MKTSEKLRDMFDVSVPYAEFDLEDIVKTIDEVEELERALELYKTKLTRYTNELFKTKAENCRNKRRIDEMKRLKNTFGSRFAGSYIDEIFGSDEE